MAIRVPNESAVKRRGKRSSIKESMTSHNADDETGLRSGEDQTTRGEFMPGTVTDDTQKGRTVSINTVKTTDRGGAKADGDKRERHGSGDRHQQLNIKIKGFMSEPEETKEENLF